MFTGRLRSGNGGQARLEFEALRQAYDAGQPLITFTDREVFASVRNRVSGYISMHKYPYKLRTTPDPLGLYLDPKTAHPQIAGAFVRA